MNITVLGAGAWGTTIANIVASNGFSVRLWARENEVVEDILANRENKLFLPGIKLSENITPVNSLEDSAIDADIIFSVIPSSFVRETFKRLKTKKDVIVVSATKGIEHDTFKRMSEVIKEVLRDVRIAALSGPNHAEEVSRKIPGATVLVAKDEQILPEIKKVLETKYFKVYTHNDLIGVEVAGAIKNIAAIAAGVCDGLNLGDNSKASIITLGLSEMIKVGKIMGGKLSTFTGLAGIGDLVATCTSKHSRNRYVGELLGKGKTYSEIKTIMKSKVAEGVAVTKSVHDFAKSNDLNLPLTNQIYKVLYEDKDINAASKDLLDLI